MRRSVLLAASFALLFVSCEKEQEIIRPEKTDTTSLYAVISEATKTGFESGTFVWKNGDRIRVLANDETTLDFKYNGESTAGAAKFDLTDETGSSVLYGEGGIAIYPSLAASNFMLDGTTLTLNQKNNYSWSEGNVEAPMISKVLPGKNLEFTHLGGLLKITIENIPASAAKLMVKTPGYVTSKQMKVIGWEGKFVQDTPYVQAYAGTDGLTGLPFTAGSSTEKTFYVPLPVGPGTDHRYPEIDIYLVNGTGATISGTEKTAKNIKIERGTVKTMATITLDPIVEPFTVTTLFGRVGNSTAVSGKAGGDATEAIFGSLRGIGWLTEDHEAYILEQSQTVRLWDVDAGTVSDPITYGENGYVPWLGTYHNGKVYFAEKANGAVYTFDPSTSDFVRLASSWSGKSPMDVKFDANGDAFLAVRDLNTIYKYNNGDFTSTPALTVNLGKWPLAMEFDADGNLIVATNGCQILCVNPSTGSFEAIAGVLDAKAIDDGTAGQPLTAKFTAGIGDIAIAPNGDIYVGDTHRIRRIVKGSAGYSDATVMTVAGSTRQTNRNNIADGVGTAATFNQIGGLMFTSDGKYLYVTDQGSCHIRQVYIGDAASAVTTPKTALKAATFNIRFITSKDENECSWDSRKTGVVSLVKDQNLDVVGFQESTSDQVTYLKANLTDYSFIESPLEPCIAYKTSKYTVKSSGSFYLSGTPDVASNPYPAWVSTDPERSRICQWAKFEVKDTGEIFYFMNTHLEVASSGTPISEDEALTIREKSADLICDRAATLAGSDPLILVGDMNSAVTETTHTDYFKKSFTDAYYRSSDLGVRFGPVATYNAYSYETDQRSKWYARCDYVYFTGALDVAKYTVVDTTYGGYYPSDHWPVVVNFKLN